MDSANPRRISEAELESLTKSLTKFGFVNPVVARREDCLVIGGHQRLLAARRLGMATVPVVFLDLSVEEARLLNLALNRIHGEWDDESLAQLLAELKTATAIDLSVSGFGDDELKKYLRSLNARERRERTEHFDVEEALEASRRQAVTLPGDLIALGDHLLLCGDSTDPASLVRLLGETPAAMTFTDPPFNVAYRGGTKGGRRRRAIANDDLPAAEWETFLRATSASLLKHTAGAIYVCMSSKELPLLSQVLAELGGHWSDTIIWAKDAFTLGRADHQRQYEPIWYGWREGVPHKWYGDRKQSDVWNIERPQVSEAHSTMKPLALVERAINNSSRTGEVVLDSFLGSGTTLIACERTGRACRGIELDPYYCDVIVARWEQFTGQTAVRPHHGGGTR